MICEGSALSLILLSCFITLTCELPFSITTCFIFSHLVYHLFSGDYGRPFTGSPTLSTMTSNSSPSLVSSIPESERDLVKLSLQSPMYRVSKAMAAKDSGLEVKDRMWLKMTIPKSFIGQLYLLILSEFLILNHMKIVQWNLRVKDSLQPAILSLLSFRKC